VGVNVLRNDARSGVGIAAATGASFLRVNVHTGSMFTDQGLLEGRAHETLRERARLAPGLRILADVHVKHASPPPGPPWRRRPGMPPTGDWPTCWWSRGAAPGRPPTRSGCDGWRRPPRERRYGWGAASDPENVEALVAAGARGFIVGSALHRDGVAGRGIDPHRVRALAAALRQARG
jgi:uncharacterized protein